MTREYRQSLKELKVILNYMDQVYIDKLPQKFKDFVDDNMDEDYIPLIDKNVPLDEQELKEDTEILLALLYRIYWSEKEEKESFRDDDLLVQNVYQSPNNLEEKKSLDEEKPKISNGSLMKESESNKEHYELKDEEKNLITMPKVPWYKKLISKIKTALMRRK